jgi:hypothetical protein
MRFTNDSTSHVPYQPVEMTHVLGAPNPLRYAR